MLKHEFQLVPPDSDETAFRPAEPLHSLLYAMSAEALQFTLDQYNDYDDPTELDQMLPETGLTRRETLRQILHVQTLRRT